MVLVITWQVRDGRAEPLLQLRTGLNSTRELTGSPTSPATSRRMTRRSPGMEFGLDDQSR